MESQTTTEASEPTAAEECQRHGGGWRSQFGHPHGFWGRVVGRLMASKNAYMNFMALEVLDVRATDHILEIGFGHGLGIQLVAARAGDGLVAGADHSATMVDQASRRNQQAIVDERVVLKQGPAIALPFEDASFDKVWEANSFHHWSPPEQGLAEARRVLKDGGALLLCLRMKPATPSKFSAPGHTTEEVEKIVKIVEQGGFHDVRTEVHHLDRDVTCLTARK